MAGRRGVGPVLVRLVAVALATLALVALALVGRADAFVYWTESGLGTIGRANLVGTGVNLTFVSGLDKPQAMAVDGAHIYWTTGLASIGRANLDGTGANGSFILGAFGAQGVAVDSAHVYWTNSSPSGDRIGRANLDGSAPFGNELDALSGHTLDAVQAAALIADATEIRQLLGCGAD
jgi:hypothetical protein